ncbi:MAG: JAB domain-containing protein [Oryzomonas sp.]|nr:JAB domain-containing protein [Oryzomonas sp.]MDR3578380.1 JAB domain-containing protein [Oryzomonas sp.]
MQHRTGEAVGALHHPDVGDIDLVWGKEGTSGKEYEDGYGLSKIIKKHPEVVDNLQDILNTLQKDDGKSTTSYSVLESKDHKAVVRLDWDRQEKKWLLTELRKDEELGTGERAGASSFTESDSPIRQALDKKIYLQLQKNVKGGFIGLDGNSTNSKLSDVTTLLQSTVNHLAADGVKELYQSEKPPVAEITGKELSDYLDADNVIKKARAYFKENLQDRLISRDGFGDVRVSDKGLEKVSWGLKTNLIKARLMPAIPDIIKNGEYHGREDIYKKRKDDVVAFHFFTGDVLLDGKRVTTGVIVAEDTFRNLFYKLYNLGSDTDALWAKLKAPCVPGSEARGAESSRGDALSNLNQTSPNTRDHVNIKIIDNKQTEITASTTPPNSDDHVKKVVTGVLHSAITRIKTPADAAHIAFPLTKRAQEAAIAIVTDANGNVLGVVQHSTGAMDSTTLSPRDLLGVVHDFPGAAEVWFAHNHPSGDPSPSHADREITSLLTALLDGSGVKSRGMVVVGQESGAFWTKGKGDRGESIPLGSLNMDKERTRKIQTYDREIVKLPSSKAITDVAHVIDYARSFGDGDSGIIILNGKMKPVSFVPMSVADMAKLKTGDPTTGSSLIMSAFHKGNGASMIMIVPALPGSQAAARNLAAFGNKFDAPLNDVIYSGNGLSFKNTGRMPEILNHFYQGGDVRRGYIRFDNSRNFEIGLLKDANLSTFIHESGHFFTEILGDLAERPDAPRQIKDDYAALLGFAGVESRDAIQAEHHEKLARAFEAYIREGSAPSVGLHSVFQRMKAWMISVYKDMTALNVQLTPEIRDVFDRMLATDTEIGRMRDMEDMKPLFATREDGGMSQAEFELYRKDAEQAGELAKEQLLRTLMAEKDREQKSWWKDERKKTGADVEGEAKDDPVYQTYHVLTTGKTFDGRAMGDIKLSRPDLVKMYGEDFVKKLPRAFQRVYSQEGGLHPDAVAEMAGFGSGDEMVRKMARAPKLKDYVKAETDRRMRERHGDMMTDGSIHEQALKDVHNDAQAKVMRAELLAIRRKAGVVGPAVKAAKESGTADAEAATRRFSAEGRAKAARGRAERNAMLEAIPPVKFFKMTASEAMGAKRVADIQPHLYAHAAGKAAREAFEAAAQGDYRRAGEAKYRELLNHYLYREADRAKDFADKVRAYATKMGSGKELGKFVAGNQFLDQIRAILDRYDFDRATNKEADIRMEQRESLDAFLRRMKDEEGVELPIPDAVRQEIRRTNYRNLSMDELRGVYDSMRMLEHAARQITQVNAGGRKVEVAEAALSLSNTLLRSIKVAADMARGSDGAGALLDRVKDVNLDIPVLLPEFMFGRFDGLKKTGPWHEFIRDRYNAAVDHQIRLRDMLFPKIMEYAHGNDIDRSMGKIHIDALDADLVKDDMIAIALNCGNGSNLDKLMRGGLRFRGDEAPTPLDNEALQEILSHLSATEIDAVNGIWKTIDLLKPEAAESARKRTGVEPNWIEAQPMEVKNGTLEGGYYPVQYDSRYGAAGETQADSSTLDRMFDKYADSSTRQGYLKERSAFAAPLSLDWQSIVSRHLDEVITEISHWQFVTDTLRLLKRPEVKDAINDRLGSAYYKNLLDWVGYTVNQDDVAPEASDEIEKFRRQIRNNMGTYALGFKVANAVNEMAVDIPPMMKQVKIASAFKGIMQFIRNPVEATRFATQASDYLRNIDDSLDRDIARALHPLAGPHSVADDIRHWSIAARTFFLKIGAAMAWHAGYIDAQEQGLQGNAAVRNADSVCRLTQGAGRGGDASAAPRDTYMKELARLIGPMMKDYLDRSGIGPESGHKAWYDVQKAQEWLAVLQPTVSDRIDKILKPSESTRPFSNDALKQSGEEVYYQSASHALDRIATDIDPATVSMRKYPATTRAESILSSLGPNVRNDGGVSDLKVVESPVSVKANDSHFKAGLATLMVGYVANAIISGIMSGKQTDKLDNLPSWILARLTLGLFDGFPLMRDMDGYAESGITGGKGKEMRPSSVLQWGKDAVDGFTKTVEATTGDGGWNRAVMQDAKAAGGATGLPNQAGSTVGRYIYDVLSGDYTPQYPWSQAGANSPL